MSGIVAACVQTEEVIAGDTDLSCKNFERLNEIASDSSLVSLNRNPHHHMV